MTVALAAYRTLERQFSRLAALADATAILDWDSQTMMPAGAAGSRAEQVATLRVLRHQLLTDPQTAATLDDAEADPSALTDGQTANLREMRRTWRHATAVPADLVEAASRAASACEMAWRTAMPASDFQGLLPFLTEVLHCQQEIAAAKAAAFGGTPYDALLDTWEPDGRAEALDRLFDDLAARLPDVLARVLERQGSAPPPLPLAGPFPIDIQRRLGLRLMALGGFDFQRGRLDVSMHPFCGGARDDTRITTRYNEADFSTALMAVMHELGHALYEQGLPREWRGQPVGDARGMAVHESQSLIIEMQACRGTPFLTFLTPLAREAFGGVGPAWSADNLRRIYQRVQPGLIRVDADEVTYPAHVILRYRLERQMIAGTLALTDLPDAWAEGMRRLLGLEVPDHARGCLQDIHWPCGAWGYFPTYTLGALIAAQLYEAAAEALPDLSDNLTAGQFGSLVGWLRAKVHTKASLLSTGDLVTAATGRPLDTGSFLRHLERRYLAG